MRTLNDKNYGVTTLELRGENFKEKAIINIMKIKFLILSFLKLKKQFNLFLLLVSNMKPSRTYQIKQKVLFLR